MSKDLNNIKEFIENNPSDSLANTLVWQNYEQLLSDTDFLLKGVKSNNEAIMSLCLEMKNSLPLSIKKEILLQGFPVFLSEDEKKVFNDYNFLEAVVFASQYTYEQDRYVKEYFRTFMKDKDFVERFILKYPESDGSLEMFQEHYREHLKESKTIECFKALLKSKPNDKAVQKLFGVYKIEVSKDLAFVKEFIAKNPESDMSENLYLRTAKTVCEDTKFVKDFIAHNQYTQLSYEMCLDDQVLKTLGDSCSHFSDL